MGRATIWHSLCGQLKQLRARVLKATGLVKSTGNTAVAALWLLKEQQDPWCLARQQLLQNWIQLVKHGQGVQKLLCRRPGSVVRRVCRL